MANVVRLTAAQALVRYLCCQYDESNERIFGGAFAIFGHGNVNGIGHALWEAREELPTYRGHNEQSMTHTALAFAKAHRRRRMMACTTSIGPGATNLVTAAATGHVNRLPVLLLPGDTFANREPDPVLQQLENPDDPGLTVNDCLRPVSRFWDRITRPEQLLIALPTALDVLTDPARCGPVTIALPQDVQTEAYDYPESFFRHRVRTWRRPVASPSELDRAAVLLKESSRPLLIVGGGAAYSEATQALSDFCLNHRIPLCETQAGKGLIAWDHELNLGAVGVTGTAAANQLAAKADLIFAVGTRLSDFTTGSRDLFHERARLLSLNVNRGDALKHDGTPLLGDAQRTLADLEPRLVGYRSPEVWEEAAKSAKRNWIEKADSYLNAPLRADEAPSDAQVLGRLTDAFGPDDVIVCAAGGLPGELHKLWRARGTADYHVEYGYSCMGYELAGGLGAKLAQPRREVFVVVGDGSYLMLNTAIPTSITLGAKLIVVLFDNRGFGCIHRLQTSSGQAAFNNLLDERAPEIDFVGHAKSLGAGAEMIELPGLMPAVARARAATQTHVIVIRTDPKKSTNAGGVWWDVPIAEVSSDETVKAARRDYEARTRSRRSSR